MPSSLEGSEADGSDKGGKGTDGLSLASGSELMEI